MALRPCAHHLWRRTHRPEEYADDVVRWLAGEIRVPPALLKPAVPFARRLVASWPDAAVETTQYETFPCGRRRLRTVFRITSYSSKTVYQLIEKTLTTLGIGRAPAGSEDTEFAWVLLGGVLNDYARRAGLRPEVTQRLLEFRLRNSDYFTMTTWFPETVEIANLRTGRVEYLDLPADQIDRVIDFAVAHLISIAGKQSRDITPADPAAAEFGAFLSLYDRILCGETPSC